MKTIKIVLDVDTVAPLKPGEVAQHNCAGDVIEIESSELQKHKELKLVRSIVPEEDKNKSITDVKISK